MHAWIRLSAVTYPTATDSKWGRRKGKHFRFSQNLNSQRIWRHFPDSVISRRRSGIIDFPGSQTIREFSQNALQCPISMTFDSFKSGQFSSPYIYILNSAFYKICELNDEMLGVILGYSACGKYISSLMLKGVGLRMNCLLQVGVIPENQSNQSK